MNGAHNARVWPLAAVVFAVSMAAWIYLLQGAGTGMSVALMSTFAFPPPIPGFAGSAQWTFGYALTMLNMWFVMMVAMMLPATLLGLIFPRFAGGAGCLNADCARAGLPSNLARMSGYLFAWLGFSIVATALQFGLEQTGVLHGMLMWSTSLTLSAGLLIAAGLYQFTPWKTASIAACCDKQVPSDREGFAAQTSVGLAEGLACVGRCVMLMLLLFAGGIMNLVWIIGLAAVSAVEGVAARRPLPKRLIGGTLLLAGGYLLLVR